MVQRSKEMVKELQAIGVGNRPIVWVGHSKGGLFVKQMLVDGELCFKTPFSISADAVMNIFLNIIFIYLVTINLVHNKPNNQKADNKTM